MVAAGCISDAREQTIGDAIAAQVNPQLPIIQDKLLNAYFSSIGSQIGAVSDRPDVHYHFYLVDSDVVNAFALPGGHVYVTRGLISRAANGAEFAGVVAHEIGHVSARHGVHKLQRELRTGSLVSVLYNTILGTEPALLQQNSLQLANVIWSNKYSRRDEREADRLAVEYLFRMGVDPNAVTTLLQTLLHEEETTADPVKQSVDWFSTHPLTASRIEDAKRNVAALGDQNPRVASLDLKAFPAFKTLITHRVTLAPAHAQR
jgi:beta-barrel assembly-enhancing protease